MTSHKNVSQRPPTAAQPLLPGINFAKLFCVVKQPCECTCQGCPPWVHYPVDCRCENALGSVPPTCNTGVHGLGRTAVFSCRSAAK